VTRPLERRFTVRWGDVDANGHMRNTAYSEFCSDTRISLFLAAGFGWDRFAAAGVGPVILREEIDYLREAAMGDDVRVDVTCGGLSPDAARWVLRHRMWRPDGEEMARVTARGGWLDLARRRLIVPPDALVKVLRDTPRSEPFEELPPLRRDG
jgi:acyl-CoA thioester hydrolase